MFLLWVTFIWSIAQCRPVARGYDAPPKSAKRSTFSHKVGQKWGFCRRVRGVRFKKIHFFGPKGPLFGGPTLPPKKINPGYGPGTMCTKWLKVGMSDMQEWTEEVLEPNKTLFLCFSLCMLKIYDRVRKQFLQL